MTRSAEAQQLSLGVLARSRKPNERRLPIHPEHFVRIDHRLRRPELEGYPEIEEGCCESKTDTFDVEPENACSYVQLGLKAPSTRGRSTSDCNLARSTPNR